MNELLTCLGGGSISHSVDSHQEHGWQVSENKHQQRIRPKNSDKQTNKCTNHTVKHKFTQQRLIPLILK